jgi:hypothetical protein
VTDEQYKNLPQLFKEIVDLDRKLEWGYKNHMLSKELKELRAQRLVLQRAAQQQYGHSIRNDGSANKSD